MAAGDAVIGALRVVLGTDTAQFEDGLKSAHDGLKSFAKGAAEVAAGVELAHIFEKAVEAIGEFVKKGIEAADQMGKMSQRIGVPVESLGALTAAANLSDVSVEGLGQSMSRLARNMIDVAAGGVGPAASAFHYLGITTKELRSLTPEQVLDRMAASFSKMKDGADKTAIAIAIFGRAGAQMIPVLNLGVKGMDDLKEKSASLGLVISEKTAKAGEKFVDATKLMGLSIQGVSNTVAAYFLPAMANAAEGFVEWLIHSDAVANVSEVIIRALKFMSDNALIFGAVLAVVFGGAAIGGISLMVGWFVRLGVAIGIAAVNTLVMLAEFLAIVGLVAVVVGGIGLLIASIIYYTDAVDRVSAAWELAKKAAGAAVEWISNKIDEMIKAIKTVLEWVDKFGGVWTWVKGKAQDALDYITTKTGEMNDELDKTAPKKEEVAGFWSWLGEKASSALDLVSTGLKSAGVNTSAWSAQLPGLKDQLEDVKKAIADILKQRPFDPEEAAKTKAYENTMGNLAIKARELSGELIGKVSPGFLQAALGARLFNNASEANAFNLNKMTKDMKDLDVQMAKTYVRQVEFDNLTPYEKWERKIKELRAEFAKAGGDQDLLRVAVVKATAGMVAAYAEMAASFVGGFAQLFQALGAKNKQMFELGKALGIAQATISTFAGAAKALEIYGPTPLGFAMIASAIAAGLAQVVKITQTKYSPSAATGGSFMVPGGQMGVDTKTFSLALAPGELVDVTPAGKARGGAGRSTEITLNGVRPKDLFTGEMVRGLFDAINKGHSDGYRIKFAT